MQTGWIRVRVYEFLNSYAEFEPGCAPLPFSADGKQAAAVYEALRSNLINKDKEHQLLRMRVEFSLKQYDARFSDGVEPGVSVQRILEVRPLSAPQGHTVGPRPIQR
ncbi:hypothetical protein SCH01S_16_01580 [Sphingomonas changbaiensis NBRC 104936]|uniref:Uncharacterized protein n=1 Tax=Sphingomonas changbaiensis NBRC 104936 TaxID=1219043 RepID=A0A0E9MM76_9SPHN|nr:hypothetical protein SCH01S_16_01580 [Sphingomonas changbaiensis NBRC 104936]